MIDIDWSIFDKYSESTCECGCGAIYRSHAKIAPDTDGMLRMHSRKPCPSCGKLVGHLQRVSSDPEVMTLGKKDT